jgi:hypothetical protein
MKYFKIEHNQRITLWNFRSKGLLHQYYSKMMFMVLNQVYYWGFKSITHKNCNYIIKTKWNYFNQKLFTAEEEAPSKLGLGLW